MLPSLSGLSLAPKAPGHAAPAIGMDGDGDPGPSSMQVWPGSRGIGVMDLQGMLVGFKDEDTGELLWGAVVEDDGGEDVTVLLADGGYSVVARDDVKPIRRAKPEEISLNTHS